MATASCGDLRTAATKRTLLTEPASLATAAPASEPGIIDLHAPGELAHDFQQLVLDLPDRQVAHARLL